ncbi:MAG TPA: hypothetical protein VGC41_14920 [Kofleriaceae bacterium]
MTWKDLETHLDELAGTQTSVTLHLESGRDFAGRVLEVVRARQQTCVVIQSGRQDASVVPLARVEALTLPDHKPEAPVVVEASSNLELKRRAKALSDTRLVPIEVADGELAPLAALFESFRIALEKVCADEVGRTAFSEQVKKVVLRLGATPGVKLSDRVLTVTSSPAERLALPRLQAQLDALL